MRFASLVVMTACQFTPGALSHSDGGEANTCALGYAGPNCAACAEGKLAIQACSHAYIACSKWIDGDDSTDTSDVCPGGCATDIDFDLGTRKFVNRLRFLSDWWAKRPETWALLASDDNVNFSAVMNARSNDNPWQCVQAAACTPEVPTECCPSGVSQDLAAVGDLYPKWDDFAFAGVAARYWRFRINTTYDSDNLVMRELELYGHDCLGELACATSNCGSGVCTSQEQARCTCASCKPIASCTSAFVGVAPACTTPI